MLLLSGCIVCLCYWFVLFVSYLVDCFYLRGAHSRAEPAPQRVWYLWRNVRIRKTQHVWFVLVGTHLKVAARSSQVSEVIL